VLTAAGKVRLRRVYFVCRHCGIGEHPLDERLGVNGSLSLQAQRMLCLAGASWSFDCAARNLRELCGLVVSDNWIRQVCQGQAVQMERWRASSGQERAGFQGASGEVEFSTDGTCVNTWEGWREMRVGIFCKRMRGESASVANWDRRHLPAPEVRVAFAAVEDSHQFGRRWGQWASRLGIKDTSQVTVLADGAAWIWEQSELHFAGAEGVLDIYHALEHLGKTAQELYGEGTRKAEQWLAGGRTALLAGGWEGIRQYISRCRRGIRDKRRRKSLDRLEDYLRKHRKRLNYPQRLAEGRAIGSGQVEGACKHMIGRRLKQTGARWQVSRANRMAILCAMLYSHNWDTYWATSPP